MKLKKIGFALMSLVLILTMIPPMTSAASKLSIVVEVNGELISFPDAKPFMDKSNRVQVPVRFVSEALGAEVGWNSKSKQVTVQLGEDTTVLTMGKKAYTVNGQTKQMDTVAQQKQNRTFVPLRFVSEALGAKVIWHKDLYSVEILTGLAAVQEDKKEEIKEETSSTEAPKYIVDSLGRKRRIEGETQKRTDEGFSFYNSYKSGLGVSYESVNGKDLMFLQSTIHFDRDGVDYNQQVKDLDELLRQKIDSETVDKIMKYVKQKTKREDILEAKEFSDKTYGIQVESSYWDNIYISIWYK
ncbi:copper amine oxidase N-terminal domain-containing protein [Paenibacillus motobuensis]|uniref:copper amine oxidase N-terminal domain-containing protein n=1 Tax=Paenibacillus TaxID=44249 RepID=UPI00203E7BCE|nr:MULTISPECIES: copper amine oxidase N-terminal domain-containing protein [Paenibacillus]MCM3042564.1 copper amine oxidase N-terminal domain-containing protein [Paenibacillus lutimineralis]MCM3649668.1 copper amine oxidase N-terminal domain-containing protein [Paenibacillus motobuensis]